MTGKLKSESNKVYGVHFFRRPLTSEASRLSLYLDSLDARVRARGELIISHFAGQGISSEAAATE
jgi:hypothetical protein